MTRHAWSGMLWCVVLLTGFDDPNPFRNLRTDAPHAILVGDGVSVCAIHQQPSTY